jgi:hypothetical protein
MSLECPQRLLGRQTATTVPIMRKAGLNNQRIALFGLCMYARSSNAAVALPQDLVDLNSVSYKLSGLIDIFDVFDRDSVTRLLETYDMHETTSDQQIYDWEECFFHGDKPLRKPEADPFILDFLRAFRAAAPIRQIADRLWEKLDKDCVTMQLRVEADWQRHIDKKESAGVTDIFLRRPEQIFKVIRNTPALEDIDKVYINADTNGLADEIGIKKMARRDFGFELLFKHDLIAEGDLPISSMMKAALDFEISRRSRRHVGPSSSSFFAVLKLVALAEDEPLDRRFYAYDRQDGQAIET